MNKQLHIESMIASARGRWVKNPYGAVKLQKGYAFMQVGVNQWYYMAWHGHISDISDLKTVKGWYKADVDYNVRRVA
jgi:hypothetical protein